MMLGVGALSCGRSTTIIASAPDAAAAVTPEVLIESLCGLTEPCCARAGRADGGKHCRASLQDILARGVYDARAAGECLASLQGSTPEGICERVTAASSPCQRALVAPRPGNKGPGDDCASDDECAAPPGDEVDCRRGPGPMGGGPGSGWCQVQRRGREGDGPCVGTVIDRGIVPGPPPPPGARQPVAFLCYREDDLQCDVAARARCEKPKAVGAGCRSDAECGKDAYCRAIVFTCVALKAVGAACNSEVACVDDAFCSLATHTCTPWIPAGEACEGSQQCRSNACQGGVCAPAIDPQRWPAFVDRFCATSDAGPP
jgi:hypothetical protein